ncbi:MAG: hypothetical protein AMXMBFR48_04870 [Ignavibacteriales bacterium]
MKNACTLCTGASADTSAGNISVFSPSLTINSLSDVFSGLTAYNNRSMLTPSFLQLRRPSGVIRRSSNLNLTTFILPTGGSHDTQK